MTLSWITRSAGLTLDVYLAATRDLQMAKGLAKSTADKKYQENNTEGR